MFWFELQIYLSLAQQKETETILDVNDASPGPVLEGKKAVSTPVELRAADDAKELAAPLPAPGDQLEVPVHY